ncbi:MAG: enoyl-CoA hydratase/isomerase family protein [Candidatus Omnitrophica bacterium]|nr:enoyl-CoA hydratase/isomerase family protein [Candidatus Omnitrophota bacterium]
MEYKEEFNIAYITFDQPDSKVNVLNAAALLEFEKILDQLKNNSSLKGLVIGSAKKDIFIAGADIKEIENITDVTDGKAKSQAGQGIMDKLEDLSIPTVAVIDGAALGGGCELALACRWRIATFNEKVRIGLPEVNLGIIPGFGGTYRLPRLLGLQGALKIILSGTPVDSKTALKTGLVDRLYPQAGLSDHVRAFVDEISRASGERTYPAIVKRGLDAFLDHNFFGRNVVCKKSKEQVLKATKGFYPAPLRALEVVQKTSRCGRSIALDMESSIFAQLVVTEISKNLVKVFYLSEKFRKLSVPGTENITPMVVAKAGVLGAGIMGGGIAQLLSHRGVWVRLKDISYDAIAKGLKAAFEVYAQSLKRKRMRPAEAAAKMAMISGTLDYSGFANADIVIEAVLENMEIKKKVFAEVSLNVSAKTIFASNTSSLSVTEMAGVMGDPSRVIGFHFFNPVHRMPLIEVITTPQTSKETLVATLEFAKRLGKTPIIVKDSPGFLVNRILLAYINEAGRLLQEGGTIEHLDKIATDFGMPMGPFTLSDEVGLDVGVKVLHVLESGLGARFKSCTIFDEAFHLKLLGKKSGKGFYIHGAERQVNRHLQALVKGRSRVSDREALTRMTHVMINEAARILQEGIVEGADTVDVGMVMGTGFPAFRGGLLRYADFLGIDQIVSDLEELENRFKDGRFKVAEYLLNLKAQGRQFFN